MIAGDVCGCKIDGGPVVPPCPPPDINIEDWSASIRRIKLKRYEAVYLTHFGRIENVKEHLKELEAKVAKVETFYNIKFRKMK